MQTKQSAVDLTDLAIGIVVLGIVVTIGANILITTRDARLTDLSTASTYNETLSFTGNTDKLANTWGKNVIHVTNSSGTLVSSGNYTYTISSTDGTITVTNLTSTIQPWKINYQWYNTSRADWSSANKAAIGLGEYGNWFTILVIVGVAALILSLIFMAFGRSSGGSGVSY